MVARNVVVGGAGVVGVAAAITSSVTLYGLAETCGIGAPFAAALPIALDVGAAVASLAWITESGTIRHWGRGIAIAALAGTVAGNSIQHALTVGHSAPSLPLILAVGACVPAMLWAVIHLTALLFRSSAQRPAATQVEEFPSVPVRPVDTPEPRRVESKLPASTPVAVPVRPTAAPVPHTIPATAVSRAPAVAPPSTIESKRGQVAERVAWLEARRKAWPGEKRERAVDEVAALIARFGGSESTAKRTRREVDEAQDRAAA